MIKLWDIENIADFDYLFFRIHKQNVFSNKDYQNLIKPRAFCNTPMFGSNLSTDWNKYSTPQLTLDFVSKQYRTGKTEFKNKDDFGVVRFIVKKVKDIDNNHKIVHDPIQKIPKILGEPNNRAHTLIDNKKSGDKEDSLEVRSLLAENAYWEILPQ